MNTSRNIMTTGKKRAIFFVILSSVGFAATSHANDRVLQLNVPAYTQDDACWCGVAAAEMVMHHYEDKNNRRWSWYPERQRNIWKLNNSFIGSFAEWQSKQKPCGPKGGVSQSEMIKMLHKKIKDRSDSFHQASSRIANGISKDFHYQVVDQIKNKLNPVLVLGNTNYSDQSRKNDGKAQHWFVIKGVKFDDNKNNFDPDKHGYYVRDPIYGSSFMYKIQSIGPGFISHREFMEKWAYTDEGRVYYLVDRVNHR